MDLSAVPGEVLGAPFPDWPEDLTTFAERKAYQRGVAHARAVAGVTASHHPVVGDQTPMPSDKDQPA